MKQGLSRAHSLKNKLTITRIFSKKDGFITYPIRISYTETNSALPVQVLFSVPKRKFKKATDRNRIKRLMREAYRLNQSEFLEGLQSKNKTIALYIGYVGKEIPSYSVIEKKIKLSLVRLLKELETKEQ
ncbi:MAG: ribonuclease P protein component [Flavobacteriales bacterium]|jgi:ribonuclease P protein component|nr:ribonuclease P protein component [Flavobacteriales bacterium]